MRRRAQRTPPDPRRSGRGAGRRARRPQLETPRSPSASPTRRRWSKPSTRRCAALPAFEPCSERPNVSAALEEPLGAIWLALDAIEKDLDARRRRGDGRSRDRARQLVADPGPGRGLGGSPRPSPRRRWRSPRSSRGPTSAIDAYVSIYVALSSLDRLEVRGRDSAGLHVFVRGHDLDLDAADVRELLDARTADPLFTSGSVRVSSELSVVRVQGRRGDRRARRQHREVAGWRSAMTSSSGASSASDTAEAVVLGHTRWASVGSISEANAHPLNQEEPRSPGRALRDRRAQRRRRQLRRPHRDGGPRVPARDHHGREGDPRARVPPHCRGRRPARGVPCDRGRARRVARDRRADSTPLPTNCSCRCAAAGRRSTSGSPRTRSWWRASRTGSSRRRRAYVRMDGETPADPERSSATRGQVVVLDTEHAGTLEGISRTAFDGTPLPLTSDDVHHAEITTRDIDRGEFTHFLLKELSESPSSFRKTLRGRIVEGDAGMLSVVLGPETLSQDLRDRVRSGAIRRVVAIGQGTAAIAAQGVAATLTRFVGSHLTAEAMAATELSGFGLDRRHVRHARRRDQPERYDDRHQPHGRPRRAERHGARDRQPSQQRPRRQGRRRALHVRRARPRDGRPVDEGVLRADRRWLPPGARAGRRVRRPRPRLAARTARRPAGAARRDGRGARTTRGDRRDRAPSRAVAPLLDGGRQRSQPDRRQRAADQALGAVLPLDLVRHRRGQEAHRPVHRAVDPRVRGRARWLERRRRREGGRVPPRAPCRADRDHHARRRPLLERGRDHRSAVGARRIWASCSRRWRVTSSASKPHSSSTRRHARSARRER